MRTEENSIRIEFRQKQLQTKFSVEEAVDKSLQTGPLFIEEFAVWANENQLGQHNIIWPPKLTFEKDSDAMWFRLSFNEKKIILPHFDIEFTDY